MAGDGAWVDEPCATERARSIFSLLAITTAVECSAALPMIGTVPMQGPAVGGADEQGVDLRALGFEPQVGVLITKPTKALGMWRSSEATSTAPASSSER